MTTPYDTAAAPGLGTGPQTVTVPGASAVTSRGGLVSGDPATGPATTDVVVVGDRGGSGPLTWGQQAIWKTLVAMGQDGLWLNLRRLITVPVDAPPVTVDDCLRGVAVLVARHESLRTRIVDVDGTPTQVVDRDGRQPVELLDLEPADPLPARPALEYLVRTPLPAAHAARLDRLIVEQSGSVYGPEEWPLRVTAVAIEGRVRYVSLVLNHVVADWHAANIVVNELRRLLRGRNPPPLRGELPLDLAVREQGERRLTERAVAHWRSVYAVMPVEQLPVTGPAADVPFLEALLLSEALGAGLDVVAAANHVTTTTVALAALCAVLGAETGHATIGMLSIVANRFQPGHDLVISPMNQLGVLALDVGDADLDRPETLLELVPQAWRRSLQAMRHARYDQVALDAFLEEIGRGGGDDVDPRCCLNDLRASRPVGRVPLPPGGLDAAVGRSVVEWRELGTYNWDCYIELRDVPGGTGLAIVADTRRLGRQRIEWVTRAVERYVVGAAVALTAGENTEEKEL